MFITGPQVIKSVTGEDVTFETLGGAEVHNAKSGVAHFRCASEDECLKEIRRLISYLPDNNLTDPEIWPADDDLNRVDESLLELVPDVSNRPYDMKDIICKVLDNGGFMEVQRHFAQNIIIGFGRLNGKTVGIVANQRLVVKNKKGEMQLGGVIYNDSADKAARFILNCNQKKIPLVFLQDVTGFMVGSRSEHAGIIKDGAKMVNAVANSVVPKITIITGNSFGAGNYAMCGKAYDPRFIYAWPSARIAVMGGEQAAKTLLQIQVAAMKAKGQEADPVQEKNLLQEIKSRYDKQASPYYAAARLWVDEIIDPADTRRVISRSIDAANHQPNIAPLKTGVFQV